MKTLNHILGAGILVIAMTVLAACDSGTANAQLQDDSLNTEVNALTQSLSLSSAASNQVMNAFAKHEGKDPGYLWYVAAELQENLTPEQKAKLMERRRGQQGRMGKGRRGGQGRGMRGQGRMGQGRGNGQGCAGQGCMREPRMGGEQGAFGMGAGPLDELLTQEQKDAITALRGTFRTDMQALRAKDNLSAEALRAEVKTLRVALRNDIQALLTDEQKAELQAQREEKAAERQARIEADRAVAAEVLGLTAEQHTGLEALRNTHYATRNMVREKIRNGETIDRDAMQAQREAHQSALANILDERQLEIVQIHRALTAKMGRGMRDGRGMGGGKGMRGRFGPRRG